MNAESIASRLARVRERVAAAVARRGPGPAVTLLGVSKRQPIAAIEAAYAAGLRDVAENYAQELRDKLAAIDHADLRWHFIGALQSNKVKYVVGRALIHTVDRAELLPILAARAASLSRIQEVLVEVKLDPSRRAGVDADATAELLDAFAGSPSLRCVGLMIIPPEGPPAGAREHFAGLRRLRDRLAQVDRPGVSLRELSMGMSSDFEIAIEEGATLVRVGTAIFGARA